MIFKFKKLRIDYLFLGLLFLLAVLLSLPLFKPGFFPIHDNQHVARLQQLDLALKQGQFPVRWVKDLGFGYGYPLFNFYPPFLYYLAEAFHLISFSFLASIKIVFILSFFLSAFFMYLWVRDFFKPKASFLASLFYLFLPYRAVDSFVRGALAEFLALAWLPALLWSGGRIFSLRKIKFKDIFLVALFLFALMTTHNLTMILFTPFFLTWCLFMFLKNRKNGAKRLYLFIASLILGAGLSCFFWLPALWEKKFTLVNEILLGKLYNFQLHFIHPTQLWNSSFGYGGSLPGLDDGLSFQIGKVHILAALAALIILLYKSFKKKKLIKDYIFYNFLLFLGALFMSLTPSKFVWEAVEPIQYVQFPWRFLGIVGLFISFVAGSLISLKNSKESSFKNKLNTLLFLVLSLLVVFLNYRFFKPQKYLKVSDADFLTEEAIKWDVSRSSFEYIPKGVELTEIKQGLQLTTLIQKQDLPEKRVEILKGEGDLEILKDQTDLLIFNIEVFKKATVQANIFSFPGWTLYINDKGKDYYKTEGLRLIRFDLDPGIYELVLRFENTFVRTAANLITVLSFLAVVVFFSFSFKKKYIKKIKN
jgi:hypothetical protein